MRPIDENTVISVEEALLKTGAIFVDTRTPKEFSADHMPKAINIPILSNEERAIVGTIYTQESAKKAIKKGIEFFSPKLPSFLKEIDVALKKMNARDVVVNCWRGGMRSRTVVALLNSVGYKAYRVKGGYKSFRAYVRERVENYSLQSELVVLSGLTCTGKTDLLHYFENSIDLEGLAQHRGSLFGALGLHPNSQKRFENLLLQRLDELKGEKRIFVEGEARKIGDVQIPLFFWKKMCAGRQVMIERGIQKRAECAAQVYNNLDDALLKETVLRLWKVIGGKSKQQVVGFLDEKKYEQAAAILLEKYYDPLYTHTLKKKTYEFHVTSDDLKKAVEKLREIFC